MQAADPMLRPTSKYLMGHGSSTAAEDPTEEGKIYNHLDDAAPPSEQPFEAYARRFFLWETCPHVARLLDEGKSITRRYVKEQRYNLVRHILPSPLGRISMKALRRSNIVDFRSSLRRKGLAAATVNRIMSALKVVFNEAEYRQDIPNNPATGVGKVKGRVQSIDIFTPEELKRLFPDDFTAIWKDRTAFTCFFLASTTGMRQGEILALQWKHIIYDETHILVEQAWKDTHELGLPKWGKTRTVFLPKALKRCLLEHEKHAYRTQPDDLVFCYPDGTRLGPMWWRGRFKHALAKAGISTAGRTLRPHCFRHTLNTILRDAGENPDKIRASLGWSDASIQDDYTHWKPEHLKNQGDIIDSLWGCGP